MTKPTEKPAPPRQIWLQWYGDSDPDDHDERPSDVTWCDDEIFPHDVAYVRADTVLLPKSPDLMTIEQKLIMHAVDAMFTNCGNSYVDAYLEQWLRLAHAAGSYHGPFVGEIREVEEKWEEWLDANGGLPDWPDPANFH
jgi:hypothetical protein